MRFIGIILGVLVFGIMQVRGQDAKKPRLDSAGDPLPAQAIHRFGSSRLTTQSEVQALDMSRDGKLIAAADRDGRVYLWESAAGKELFRTGPDSGKRVALSPDGRWLALGEDAPFALRDLHKDGPPLLPIGNGPKLFVFAPDSKALAIAQMEETDIVLLEIPGGKELRRFAGLDATAAGIAFSPDGKRLAAATVPAADDEKPMVRIVIWDALNGNKLKEITQRGKQIKGLNFLPDNKTLIGLSGARLSAWDVNTGDPVKKQGPAIGSSFALDVACKKLATTDGPQVVDFDSGKVIHEFESPAFLRHIALSGDGNLLAASPARLETASPRILVWDLKAGKERTNSDGHSHFIEAVSYAHDGRFLATASNVEGKARVWDAQTSKLVHALNIDSLAAKKSGGPRSRRTLVDGLAFYLPPRPAGGEGSEVRGEPSKTSPRPAGGEGSGVRGELFVGGQRWDLATGKPIPLAAEADFVFDQTNSHRAIVSPDAHLAASFLPGQAILLWDPAKGQAIRRLEPSDKKRADWFTLAFSPDDRFAATGKWFAPITDDDDVVLDNTIYVWEVASGKRVKMLRAARTPVVRLMFSPDGETLAVISYPSRLELWHLPTGRRLREMNLSDSDEPPRTFSVPTVAFAPHGQWLVLTHKEGEITLLETLTGKEIATFRGHHGFISSLAFSPDSRRLISGGRDTTALLWAVIPEGPELPKSWKDDEKLWDELGGPPPIAYKAVWALIANPERALGLLSRRLLADEGASEKEIRELVVNLASPKFDKRDVAMRRLKQIGTRALPALEDALKKSPDLETTRRINELLKTVETSLTPEMLRDVRGMQILEMIATPAARKVLETVAAGDAGAAKTRLAQAALDRLKRNR